MADYISLLRSIGLNDSEANIYMAALERGPSSPQDLVQAAGFSRPATYAGIDLLVNKGLLSSVVKGKRFLYIAEPPERVVEYGRRRVAELESKVKDIDRLAPELQLLQHGERPTIRLYEGVEGLKAILADVVESRPKETLEFSDLDAVRKVLSADDLDALQKILIKRKTPGRAILCGKVNSVRAGVIARTVPSGKMPFGGDVLIYGSKVAIVTFTGKVTGALMESEAVAETMRAFFELAWSGAADYSEMQG